MEFVPEDLPSYITEDVNTHNRNETILNHYKRKVIIKAPYWSIFEQLANVFKTVEFILTEILIFVMGFSYSCLCDKPPA